MFDIFQDSGAFSAKSTGKQINIKKYASFLKRNLKDITVYANLDVIGSSEKTWKNQEYLESEGLSPIPVFHPLTDPITDLYRCLENYEYFAVGGIAHKAMYNTRLQVLDEIWEICVDEKGMPLAKIHGFGMADIRLINRYPWYSVDSSSWVQYGRYGIVIVPKKKKGEYVYTVPPIKLFVTYRSPKKEKDDQSHLDNLTENMREVFLDYLKEKKVPLGVSEIKDEEEIVVEEGVINNNFWRDFLNYCFYQDMCDAQPNWPWKCQIKKRSLI